MANRDIIIIVVVAIGAIALLFFLVRRNRKDMDTLNPDATDAVEEIHEDESRNRDKN